MNDKGLRNDNIYMDADKFIDFFTYWIGAIHFQIGYHAVYNKKLN